MTWRISQKRLRHYRVALLPHFFRLQYRIDVYKRQDNMLPQIIERKKVNLSFKYLGEYVTLKDVYKRQI